MKTLITGGTGFVGTYLSEYLKNQGHEVVCTSRKQDLGFIKLSLTDYTKSEYMLDFHKPSKVFHLAFQPSVHISFEQPFETLYDNYVGAINMLQIAQKLKFKLVIAGTSEVYKTSNDQMVEESPLEPRSPYTISKLPIDYFVQLMARELGINTTYLRLFNHTGPGQSDSFVLSSFAKQLALIKTGAKEEKTIKVGNLETKRDFTDVRDVIRAYDLVSEKEEYGEIYNVCSGTAYKIKGLLDKLIEIADADVKVEIDPKRLRPVDIPVYYGSYEKINREFGWEPAIPIEQTLKDLFNWWVKKVLEDEYSFSV